MSKERVILEDINEKCSKLLSVSKRNLGAMATGAYTRGVVLAALTGRIKYLLEGITDMDKVIKARNAAHTGVKFSHRNGDAYTAPLRGVLVNECRKMLEILDGSESGDDVTPDGTLRLSAFVRTSQPIADTFHASQGSEAREEYVGVEQKIIEMTKDCGEYADLYVLSAMFVNASKKAWQGKTLTSELVTVCANELSKAFADVRNVLDRYLNEYKAPRETCKCAEQKSAMADALEELVRSRDALKEVMPSTLGALKRHYTKGVVVTECIDCIDLSVHAAGSPLTLPAAVVMLDRSSDAALSILSGTTSDDGMGMAETTNDVLKATGGTDCGITAEGRELRTYMGSNGNKVYDFRTAGGHTLPNTREYQDVYSTIEKLSKQAGLEDRASEMALSCMMFNTLCARHPVDRGNTEPALRKLRNAIQSVKSATLKVKELMAREHASDPSSGISAVLEALAEALEPALSELVGTSVTEVEE